MPDINLFLSVAGKSHSFIVKTAASYSVLDLKTLKYTRINSWITPGYMSIKNVTGLILAVFSCYQNL